ncbi:NAD(P)/FAD-dependent oxidoreductase [Rhizobium halophytocola]|uniref:Glycine/D-amino acid oxidase-like deaminating enzyme n=1 Tax=Rhizobium halophytocola TaxID=735519 RepID=A0ABS4DUJ1_9HYPH|nr:FAD-dependent oxidoreductase [Rhizobium halophytocola]MBP1849362.1 glycine/D-amino acid oxidase-like deaminating enzyme [Rhizobium halophytocola]
MVSETFGASLWSAITAPATPYPQLAEDCEVDIIVVGAGYLGMNTAYQLAVSGLKVALIEATEPGFGASGRNTGFVVPTLKKALSPSSVVARFGEKRGEAFNAMIGGSGTHLFSLMRENRMDCAAEQTGWMQPAHSRSALAGCAAQVADWQQRGFSAELLDGAETERRTGMKGYHGAMLLSTGGQINPLAYARELARACVARGVRLFARSPVTDIVADGSRWIVKSANGQIRGGQVVLTTNAMVGKLCPKVDAAIIPTRSFQIATQRFGEDMQQRILSARSPIADSRRHLFAARWSPDGRIVGGGLVYPGPFRMARTRKRFEKRFQQFLPELGSVRAEYVWTGTVAVTLDALPRLFTLAPGLWAPIGCNGRGVALTAAFGRELANFLAGKVSADDFVVPITAPDPIPLRSFATLGPYFWLPYSEMKDRQETEIPA